MPNRGTDGAALVSEDSDVVVLESEASDGDDDDGSGSYLMNKSSTQTIP